MSYGGHLLSAVKRFHPELRLCLPRASQLFRKWQRCYVPSRAIPASWALVEALMGVACPLGLHHLALILAPGFNCLLRTSEMMAITHQHVVHERAQALSILSVIIPGSKTSQGNPQVLLVQPGALSQTAGYSKVHSAFVVLAASRFSRAICNASGSVGLWESRLHTLLPTQRWSNMVFSIFIIHGCYGSTWTVELCPHR